MILMRLIVWLFLCDDILNLSCNNSTTSQSFWITAQKPVKLLNYWANINQVLKLH